MFGLSAHTTEIKNEESVPSKSTWKKDDLNNEIVKVIRSAECITNNQKCSDNLRKIHNVRSEGQPQQALDVTYCSALMDKNGLHVIGVTSGWTVNVLVLQRKRTEKNAAR